MLRALIADDEKPARQRLVQLLSEVAPVHAPEGIEVVGEATHGDEALDMVSQLRPDIVFLDVAMPEMSGIDVAERMAPGPSVVFTTAYDQYAVSAFELGAIDYLRKPFGAERLRLALSRLSRRTTSADPTDDLTLSERIGFARSIKAIDAPPLTRLFVRDRHRITVVPVGDIERLAGEDDYVALHLATSAGGRTHLVYLTLTEFERRLDPTQFVRVHRSHIVNLDHVVALEPGDPTRLSVVMRSGARIMASRKCSRELRGLAI